MASVEIAYLPHYLDAAYMALTSYRSAFGDTNE